MYICVHTLILIYPYICMAPLGGPGSVGDVDGTPARYL